jgi:hypothetical protein
MAERGITGDGRRGDLRQARRVRQLRLPREPLGELRLPGVRVVVAQAPLPGRVLRRRCSTPSRWASTRRTRWCRTPAATGWWCAPPTSTRRLAAAILEDREATRRRRGAAGIGSVRGVGTSSPSGSRPPVGPYASTWRIWRVAAPELTLPRARGTGHRGGVRRVLRTSSGGGPVGGGGGGAGRSPTAWPGSSPASRPPLPGMTPARRSAADLWATGVAPDGHPTRFLRDRARRARGRHRRPGWGVEPKPAGCTVAGVVTHRQRPATAGGTTFINLEDETGLINVVVSKGCWARYRRTRPRRPGAAGAGSPGDAPKGW